MTRGTPVRSATGAGRARDAWSVAAPALGAPLRQVQVWFGSHVVAEYAAAPHLAARYEDAMRRRFAGLRVTSEELTGDDKAGAALPSLPSERLWELAP